MPFPTPKSSNNGSENTTDMVNINGFDFYEEPGICGTCPFLITGNALYNDSGETLVITKKE